jgi:uncharacterized protein HemX
LLTARIALLARASEFQADIAASETWLKQYFDVRASRAGDARTLNNSARRRCPAKHWTPRELEALRVLRIAQDSRTRARRDSGGR